MYTETKENKQVAPGPKEIQSIKVKTQSNHPNNEGNKDKSNQKLKTDEIQAKTDNSSLKGLNQTFIASNNNFKLMEQKTNQKNKNLYSGKSAEKKRTRNIFSSPSVTKRTNSKKKSLSEKVGSNKQHYSQVGAQKKDISQFEEDTYEKNPEQAAKQEEFNETAYLLGITNKTLRKEIKELKAEKAAIVTKNINLKNELKKAILSKNSFESDIELLELEVSDMKIFSTNLETKIAYLKNSNTNLKNKLADSIRSNNILEGKLADSTRSNKNLKHQIEARNECIQKLNRLNKKLGALNAELKVESISPDETQEYLKMRIEKLQEENSVLKENQKSDEIEIRKKNRVIAEFEQARNSNLNTEEQHKDIPKENREQNTVFDFSYREEQSYLEKKEESS